MSIVENRHRPPGSATLTCGGTWERGPLTRGRMSCGVPVAVKSSSSDRTFRAGTLTLGRAFEAGTFTGDGSAESGTSVDGSSLGALSRHETSERLPTAKKAATMATMTTSMTRFAKRRRRVELDLAVFDNGRTISTPADGSTVCTQRLQHASNVSRSSGSVTTRAAIA